MSAPAAAPVLAVEELASRLDVARSQGRTIALANGCFDLLHVGHVRYLAAAAAEADLLVVAINSDRSVAGLKGEGRPLLNAAARAEIVSGLRGVAFVTVFDEPSADRLIRALRPDVHCKGTDYAADQVPELDTVRAIGGRVAIVGDAKRHSTGDLIDSLRRRD